MTEKTNPPGLVPTDAAIPPQQTPKEGGDEQPLADRPTTVDSSDRTAEMRVVGQTAAKTEKAKPIVFPNGVLDEQGKIKNSEAVQQWLLNGFAKQAPLFTALLGAHITDTKGLTTKNGGAMLKQMSQATRKIEFTVQEEMNALTAPAKAAKIDPVSLREMKANKLGYAQIIISEFNEVSSKEPANAAKLINQINTLKDL